MTPDEQEALSRKHDPRGLTIRILASGTYAVYDQWNRLLRFTDRDMLPVTLAECFRTHDFNEMPKYSAPQTARQQAALAALKELGL